MVQLTEANWKKINEDYQAKLDEISRLNQKNDILETCNESWERGYKKLQEETKEIAQENVNMEVKLMRDNANLSTCLENLNECFVIMERHGLKNRNTVVTGFDTKA